VGPGDAIDTKYEIVRQLGQGGMGAVYEARHSGTGRRVAVKVIVGETLQKNAAVIARFQREARAAGAIESQHVVQVLDTGFDPKSGHPYLVMEFLTGRDLQATIEKLGPLSPNLALRIVSQTCLGLMKAHEAGVVHRDLKPANVFLARLDAGVTDSGSHGTMPVTEYITWTSVAQAPPESTQFQTSLVAAAGDTIFVGSSYDNDAGYIDYLVSYSVSSHAWATPPSYPISAGQGGVLFVGSSSGLFLTSSADYSNDYAPALFNGTTWQTLPNAQSPGASCSASIGSTNLVGHL